jgi:hypothetical protein
VILEGTGQITDADRTETLRLILEREQQRPVTYEEASELGESLISFYEVLGAQPADPEQTQAVDVSYG